MNAGTIAGRPAAAGGDGAGRRRRATARVAALVAVLAAAALLTAACGGGSASAAGSPGTGQGAPCAGAGVRPLHALARRAELPRSQQLRGLHGESVEQFQVQGTPVHQGGMCPSAARERPAAVSGATGAAAAPGPGVRRVHAPARVPAAPRRLERQRGPAHLRRHRPPLAAAQRRVHQVRILVRQTMNTDTKTEPPHVAVDDGGGRRGRRRGRAALVVIVVVAIGVAAVAMASVWKRTAVPGAGGGRCVPDGDGAGDAADAGVADAGERDAGGRRDLHDRQPGERARSPRCRRWAGRCARAGCCTRFPGPRGVAVRECPDCRTSPRA